MRIEDWRPDLRKVAESLGSGWNVPFEIGRVLLADLFQVEKEERLIFDYRPVHLKPILIAQVIGFLAGVEEIARIEYRALAIPPAAAVKFVCALLQHNVHQRTAVVSILGGEAVVLHLEFLNDFDRGLVINVGVAAFSLLRRTDGRAVESHFGGRIALAVGNKVCA